MEYAVTLKAIRRKVLPTIDDEFAKDLGLDSVEALRQRIRDDLVKDAERTNKREMRDDLLRQLVDAVDRRGAGRARRRARSTGVSRSSCAGWSSRASTR